ncbi:MAG: aminopeptidase P family protein [Rhodospirillaceae bacterium]|nr:aminopeptidase P family protein [Rhodospirillaceae bacterium]
MNKAISPEPTFDAGLHARVRERLKSLGLAGMIVPHTNAYQSEYLPAGDERLLRLSGFSGSAGVAIVMQDCAAIFVDGRYTIQSRAEVDENVFEICHLANTPPAGWLREHIKPGEKICYDAWHFTPSQLSIYETAVAEGGGELVALEQNPIDSLWPDRPRESTSAIKPHGENYCGLGSYAKRKMIATNMKKSGISAQIISGSDNVSWLFNIRGDDVPFTPLVLGFAILYSDTSAKLFVEPKRFDAAAIAHMGKDVEIIEPTKIGDCLDALGKTDGKIRVAIESVPLWIKSRLEKAGAKVVVASDPCLLPKAAKNPTEVSNIRNAHIRDGVALSRFLAWLDENVVNGKMLGQVSEIDAAEKLESFRAQHEMYLGPSFTTISGSGPNGAIVHYRANAKTDRMLGNGELYLVDSGGQYPDGTTDVTRTIAIGKPTAEMKDRFTRVLQGHIRLSSQIFPSGTAGQELDAIARQPLWQVGLDYDHGTGHGVGQYLGVHEGPQRIAKKGVPVALKVGMVISVEPGYYKEGEYGIRIENLVTVVGARPSENNPDGLEMLGFDVLTMAPIDKNLIDAKMLGSSEINWLNAYHQDVFDILNPHLSGAEKDWLAGATAPLKN